MRKNCLPAGFEPAALLQVRILWELFLLINNFFAMLVLRSRRFGGSFVGFRADSLKAR